MIRTSRTNFSSVNSLEQKTWAYILKNTVSVFYGCITNNRKISDNIHLFSSWFCGGVIEAWIRLKSSQQACCHRSSDYLLAGGNGRDWATFHSSSNNYFSFNHLGRKARGQMLMCEYFLRLSLHCSYTLTDQKSHTANQAQKQYW